MFSFFFFYNCWGKVAASLLRKPQLSHSEWSRARRAGAWFRSRGRGERTTSSHSNTAFCCCFVCVCACVCVCVSVFINCGVEGGKLCFCVARLPERAPLALRVWFGHWPRQAVRAGRHSGLGRTRQRQAGRRGEAFHRSGATERAGRPFSANTPAAPVAVLLLCNSPQGWLPRRAALRCRTCRT